MKSFTLSTHQASAVTGFLNTPSVAKLHYAVEALSNGQVIVTRGKYGFTASNKLRHFAMHKASLIGQARGKIAELTEQDIVSAVERTLLDKAEIATIQKNISSMESEALASIHAGMADTTGETDFSAAAETLQTCRRGKIVADAFAEKL